MVLRSGNLKRIVKVGTIHVNGYRGHVIITIHLTRGLVAWLQPCSLGVHGSYGERGEN